jgi:putative hydroxymethylpyrimidine transport system permease protein
MERRGEDRAGRRGWWMPAALAALLIAGWQFAIWVSKTPDYLLPTPSRVAVQTVQDAGLLANAARVTAVEILVGFALAVFTALAVATLLHFSTVARLTLLPLLVLSQTVPTVLFAPLLTIALGYALTPKLVIVAIVCFFPIVVNAVDGFASVSSDSLELMRALGARRLATFRLLVFPAALPAVFSGARVAATYAAVGAVFAEWAGSSAGLGFVILQAEPDLETARIFAAVLTLCLIALALYTAVTAVERLVVPRKGVSRHA